MKSANQVDDLLKESDGTLNYSLHSLLDGTGMMDEKQELMNVDMPNMQNSDLINEADYNKGCGLNADFDSPKFSIQHVSMGVDLIQPSIGKSVQQSLMQTSQELKQTNNGGSDLIENLVVNGPPAGNFIPLGLAPIHNMDNGMVDNVPQSSDQVGETFGLQQEPLLNDDQTHGVKGICLHGVRKNTGIGCKNKMKLQGSMIDGESSGRGILPTPKKSIGASSLERKKWDKRSFILRSSAKRLEDLGPVREVPREIKKKNTTLAYSEDRLDFPLTNGGDESPLDA